MTYTKKQRALMELWRTNRLRRINLLEGSVSSGKTWLSLVLWAFWIKTMPKDGLYLMCAKSLTTLKRNCLILLLDLVGPAGFQFSPSAKEGWLFGRHIILEGANDIRSESKIRGVTLQGAYCDELTQFPRDFFAMLLSRLRRPGAKLFATTNPDAPGHWLKVEYIDRAEELDFLDVKFLLSDNTTLPEEYVRNIMLEYTGVFYQRFILGQWVLAEGLIYPMMEEAIEEPPDGTPESWLMSIDYGTMNAFAALLWGKFGAVWWALAEYYYSGRDSQETKTNKDYADDLDTFTADLPVSPARKLKTVIDPSATAFITELRKRDRSHYHVLPADNDVIPGIQDTASAMQQGIIKISPRCKNLIREGKGYRWDEDAVVDRPTKEDDHVCDALRYAVYTMRWARPRQKYVPTYMRGS